MNQINNAFSAYILPTLNSCLNPKKVHTGFLSESLNKTDNNPAFR